ncbi:MAG: class I SAM-dependent methyltransferase, partial [Hyphomicrobiaceae bacterium]
MEYDVAERRDTPLALKLKQRIGRQGPVSVADYIRACLSDPEHGYYVRHPAIGRAGDFITAPEISQVFGELVGLWCAVVWQQMGSPRRFNLVELGPGRGTLISDALRAARIVPGFLDAADVLLVESNAALKQMQQDALAGSGARLGWGEMRNLAPAPTVLIANEFLDVLPISQVMLTKEGWVERAVGIDGAGRLQYVAGRRVDAKEPERLITAGPGEIFETRELDGIIGRLGELSLQASMAVLFVDYGHARSLAGDSLQAVRNHRFEHPLASPGEADLTSQVDFEALREAA